MDEKVGIPSHVDMSEVRCVRRKEKECLSRRHPHSVVLEGTFNISGAIEGVRLRLRAELSAVELCRWLRMGFHFAPSRVVKHGLIVAS